MLLNSSGDRSSAEEDTPSVRVECPPIRSEWHESWDSFDTFLQEYQRSTNQLFRVRSSTPAETRNKTIKAKDVWTSDELLPEGIGHYYKKFECTHAKDRRVRGGGRRSGHLVRSTGCSASFSATMMYNKTHNAFQVKISRCVTTHNHVIGPDVFQNYPSQRQIRNEGVIEVVNELRLAGSKPRLILQYLRKNTDKKVILRDVHNLVQRLKLERHSARTVEDRLEIVLRSFCSSEGNASTVFVDDAKTIQTITVQTHQMRRFFKAFPEVVLLDATHNTNDSRYKLFSFMVNDVFGHGQYVQHALLENESHSCMMDAIAAFKKANPTWDKIRVFMVDKDFSEVSLLEKNFPSATVLLCWFHVKKYLRTEMTKSVYGGRYTYDTDKVEDSVDMMMRAEDEAAYTHGLRYMYYLLDGFEDQGDLPEPEHPFLKYFIKNWDGCKRRWSAYARSGLAHLGNNTNNRLEASWGRLKDILRHDMGVDECVETILFLESVAEMEYASKYNVVGTRKYHETDEQLGKVASIVSTHAYDLIKEEYDLLRKELLHYAVKVVHTSMFELKSDRTAQVYHINAQTYTCSCTFMRTRLLPCHHVMFLRRHMKKRNIIPASYLHQRWVVASEANRPVEKKADDERVSSAYTITESHMRSTRHAVLNGTTKWKAAMDIAGRVVEAMSKQGTPTFVAMCEALKEFDVIVTRGDVPAVGDESTIPATVPSSEPNTNSTNCDNSPDFVGASTAEEASSAAHEEVDSSTSTNVNTNGTNHDTNDKQGSLATTAERKPSAAPGLEVVKAYTKKSKMKKKAVDRGIENDDGWGNLDDWSDVDSESDDATDEAFDGARLSESVRSRGRPAIKRSQKAERKNKRMKTSKEEATRLVLGTLVPVKDLKAVRSTLSEAYTVLSAMPVLGSLTQADAPQWKRTGFTILSKSRPTLLHVTEVYPLAYVKKCLAGIKAYRASLSEDMQKTNSFGVKITGVGTIKEEDFQTMEQWHSAFELLEGMADTILWIRSSKYDRISLGPPFDDTVHADIGAFANQLEEVPLSFSMETMFGPVPASELQWFRRSEWFQDSSIKIVLGYLKEVGFNVRKVEVGIINPMHSHISQVEPRRELISSTEPFNTENQIVLMPMWIESHWCGVTFNFMDWTIRIFDPMQHKSNYLALEKQVVEVVPTIARKFTMKRMLSPYQEDIANCGLYCAIFFECQVRGVPMPSLRRTVLGYLRFRYIFKACAGDREWT